MLAPAPGRAAASKTATEVLQGPQVMIRRMAAPGARVPYSSFRIFGINP